MRFGPRISIVTAVVVTLTGSHAVPRVLAVAPMACESLAQTPLTNRTVISAESVQAGAFTPPNSTNVAAAFKTLPAFCRVVLRLAPTPDSDLRVEVWLPASGCPLCAYPTVARYVGSGSTDDAKNFRCQTP